MVKIDPTNKERCKRYRKYLRERAFITIGNKCVFCGDDKKLHCAHVKPTKLSGGNARGMSRRFMDVIKNPDCYRPMCKDCHVTFDALRNLNTIEEPISGFKTTEVQPLLWHQPLGNHGHVRNIIGDLAAVRLVVGRRHKTDCTADYCLDISAGDTYFESKAVGRSKTAFVYGGRLNNDRAFALDHQLVYVIWYHATDSSKAATKEQLEALMLRLRGLYVVPFRAIDAVCQTKRPDKLNSKYGGSDERPEYGSGYRINLSLLEQWQHPLPEWAGT